MWFGEMTQMYIEVYVMPYW